MEVGGIRTRGDWLTGYQTLGRSIYWVWDTREIDSLGMRHQRDWLTGVWDPRENDSREPRRVMFQLDANLIEGEPYNPLARKNKRQLNVAWQNSNVSEMRETSFKNPPRQTASVWGTVQCRQHTDFFVTAHPPVGQKTSLVIFKHKITTSANYTDVISTR